MSMYTRIDAKSHRVAKEQGVVMTHAMAAKIAHMASLGFEFAHMNGKGPVFSPVDEQEFWTLEDWHAFEDDCFEERGAFSEFYDHLEEAKS